MVLQLRLWYEFYSGSKEVVVANWLEGGFVRLLLVLSEGEEDDMWTDVGV